jgi:hypothetical protein
MLEGDGLSRRDAKAFIERSLNVGWNDLRGRTF